MVNGRRVRILPMGERALLVEPVAAHSVGPDAVPDAVVGGVLNGGSDAAHDGVAFVLTLRAGLEASAPPGVVEIVPAARTVLVAIDPAVLSGAAARAWIARTAAELRLDATPADPGAAVVLDVRYTGPDLEHAAQLLGLGRDALIAAHSDAAWTVAFTGFAPGFAYLVSADWPHDVPRLDAPRTRVPAGSVGLAGTFSGAYPRSTPGGWQLIGTTEAALFDPDASPPALLQPGASVRFRAVRETLAGGEPDPLVGDVRGVGGFSAESSDPASISDAARALQPSDAARRLQAADATRRLQPPDAARKLQPQNGGLTVIQPGPLTTIQDLGRAGVAAQGIARAGALDRAALRRANRLVGNAEHAAGLEITVGGFAAVTHEDHWIAVTGALGPIAIGGRACDVNVALHWPAGEELHIGPAERGLRSYLAVRGGIDAGQVAGSRASDLMSGLGPAPLTAGDVVPVGVAPHRDIPVVEFSPWGAPDDAELELELAPGPRADWFAPAAHAALFDTVWTTTADADRTGIRLDGAVLHRTRTGELVSEPMVPGALQVPPSGRPTILLADGPVTGGYPVIAVVTDASLDALAQARPGTRIRFRHARPAS